MWPEMLWCDHQLWNLLTKVTITDREGLTTPNHGMWRFCGAHNKCYCSVKFTDNLHENDTVFTTKKRTMPKELQRRAAAGAPNRKKIVSPTSRHNISLGTGTIHAKWSGFLCTVLLQGITHARYTRCRYLYLYRLHRNFIIYSCDLPTTFVYV